MMPGPKRSHTLPVYQNDNLYLTQAERMRFRAQSSGARQLHDQLNSKMPGTSILFEDQEQCNDHHKENDDSDRHSINSSSSSSTSTHTTHPHPHRQHPLPIRQRLRHFTWAWYTLPMSTGGLSVLLFNQPYPFRGLWTLGLASYVFNLILFVLVTTILLVRFFLHPSTFRCSLSHPRESFFIPTSLLSIATIITSSERYLVTHDHPTGLRAIHAAFWVYLALAALLAVVQYTAIFSRGGLRLEAAMPTWILPIFPVMLAGTIASVISQTQPSTSSVEIIVAGLTCQGLGLSVAGMMYALLILRLLTSGLPDREHRPGLFMCVGPPAFTCLALLGMANGLPEDFDPTFHATGTVDVGVLKMLATVSGVFLWGLGAWWFGVAALSVAIKPPQYFHLGWWASVFPSSGFTLASIALGKAMRCEAILGVATGMSVGVVVTYLVVFGCMVRAVWLGDVMYPGRDEDVEDN